MSDKAGDMAGGKAGGSTCGAGSGAGAPSAVAARTWLGDDGCWHIDVRGLAPPQPFVAIVALVARNSGPDGRAVVVHHDRDPVLLYPELAERGWCAEPLDAEPGEVRLRLAPEA